MLIAICLSRACNSRSNTIHQVIFVGKNRLGRQHTFNESHIGFPYFFSLIAFCKSKYKRKTRNHSCMRPMVFLLTEKTIICITQQEMFVTSSLFDSLTSWFLMDIVVLSPLFTTPGPYYSW